MARSGALLPTLLSMGAITPEDLEAAQKESAKSGEPVHSILVRRRLLTEEDISSILAGLAEAPFLKSLAGRAADPGFMAAVPREFARRHALLGLNSDSIRLEVATPDPLDLHPLDEVAARVNRPVKAVGCPRSEVMRALNQAFEETAAPVDAVLSDLSDDAFEGITREVSGAEDLLDMANRAPVVKLVNTMLSQALPMRASDVHLQPFADHLRVRYRVDGILYTKMDLPRKVQDAVTSRIKVMCKMDIAERRLPQDGGMSFTYAGREVDVRVSSIPTQHGERIVMRLQDKSSGIYRLDRVGLSARDLAAMRKLINLSHGIILVTGPTGSGKTTTLYSALSEINSPQMNIITIEDPVEYLLSGVSQIQVSPKKGLTFASGLRSIVRQDPDVIMIGEIRDIETARIAVQSALTGHLVFSTLHTNDSPGAVSRLLDLGVEPYLVNSSLLAVLAQRLIRLVCRKCVRDFEPDASDVEAWGLNPSDLGNGPMARGEGCEICDRTGYSGRLGIFELMVVDDVVREQVGRRASASEIKRTAVQRGLVTLRADALCKMREGLTTPEEVVRATQLDVI